MENLIDIAKTGNIISIVKKAKLNIEITTFNIKTLKHVELKELSKINYELNVFMNNIKLVDTLDSAKLFKLKYLLTSINELLISENTQEEIKLTNESIIEDKPINREIIVIKEDIIIKEHVMKPEF